MFPPYCYHSIESIDDSECLVFTSKSREGDGYEGDTYRINDINSFKMFLISTLSSTIKISAVIILKI